MSAKQGLPILILSTLLVFTQPKIWAFDLGDSITQELGLTVQQEVNLYEKWDTQMHSDLDWYLGVSDRITFNTAGSLNWLQRSGPYGEENPNLRGDPEVFLNEALLAFNLYELGMRFYAGKTVIKHGSAVLFPILDFLVEDLKTAGDEQKGLWMSGASCAKDSYFAEIWFSPTHSDFKAKALFHTAYTFDIHRLGLVYYYNGGQPVGGQPATAQSAGQTAGAYYSGQISDSLIPYAEVAVSNKPQDTWNTDATCGLSYAPSFANAALFFEYRFLSSGSISNFHTPVHSGGLRLQNSRQIADLFDCSLTAFYFAPDGLYFSAQSAIYLIDRLEILLGATSLVPMSDIGETAWWQDTWHIQLAAKWILRTYE